MELRDWKEPIYAGAPQRRWLEAYGGRFDTVDVNSSYSLPKVATVQTWADQTPEGFLFAVKVSRYLMHIKRLGPPKTPRFAMLERLEPIVAAASSARCSGSGARPDRPAFRRRTANAF